MMNDERGMLRAIVSEAKRHQFFSSFIIHHLHLEMEVLMITKYNVEYSLEFRKRVQTFHYQTDDPVEAVEFISEALEKRFQIITIHHEGIPLTGHEFDKMIKTAAGMVAARLICASLKIKTEEERFRFGFGA